ncbi:uncharacterized protein LOC143037571 [Oratosquilla oratoria]|uniref:uncharacterized protein LOC143037571 n=1 Tax=Oratosquilla oratoria TaxID=337810 RepID=UPI003F766CB2
MDLLLVADQKVEPGWICGPEGLQKPQDRCLWTREKTNEKWQYRFFRSKEIKEMIKTNPQLLRAPWIDQIPNLNLDNFLLLLVYRKVEVKVGSRRREAHVKTLSVGPAAHLLFRSMLYTGSHIIDELERIVDTAIKTKFHIYDTFNTLGKFAKIVYLGENTYRQTTYEAFRLILKHVLSTDSAHVPILAHIIFPPPVPEICSAMDTNAQEQSSRRQNIDRNSLELNPELTEEGRGGGSLTYSRTNRSAVNSEHETRAPHTDTTSRGESGSEGTKGLSQSRDQIATTNITGDNKETHKSADVPQAVPLSTHHTCEDILPQVHTSKTKNIDKMQNTSVTYRECRELLKTLHLIDGDHPPKSLELSSTRTTPSSPDADSATSSTNRPALPISRNTQNSSTSLSHPNVSQHPGRVISHADPTQSFTGATSCSSATITDSYLDEPLGLAASASVTRITNSDKDSRVDTSARCAETKNKTSILPLSERVDTSAQATRTTNSAEDSETTTAARVEPITSVLGTNIYICDSLKPEFLHPATPTTSNSAKMQNTSVTYRECRELLKTLHLIDGDHPPKSLELSSTRTTPSSPDANSATSSTNRPALPISRNTQNSSTSLSHPNVSQHPGRVISHADPTQSFTGATSCSSATITDSYLDEPLGLAASASVTRITNSDKDSRVNTSARCAETKNNTSILPLSERVDTSAQATRTTNSAEDSETTTSSARVEPVTSILGTNTSICDSLKPEFLHPATPTASYSAKKDKCGIRRKIFGTVSSATKSRTLLLLGAKGSGKTCLINAVANFISGGKSDTEKKLTVSDEVAETGFASTDNITGYTFVFKDQEENVALTLIDTPGMNDSSGNEVRDHVESLKMFLTNAKHKGLEIHCIAFVVQAHLVRLTSSERLVMDNMKTLFGQDVSDHMVNLITFADNQKPPVVEALNHYGLSTRHCFIFNNSVFCGSSEESEELDRIYWKISHKSWKKCWKVVRDLSPLTTNTMVSIQKEIYATSRQDIAMRELQAEINGLLQLCRGPYNSKVEKGRQRVWDAARVAFQILRTTGNGRYPSLWSLIEDTVPKKYGFEQARKVSHFLLVGTSIQLKDTIVAILRSNVVLQGQLIRMENLTKSRLRQPIHTLKNMQLAYSDPKINLDILPPIKTLVIKNTAIILSKLINDNSNNCITQNGIVKYLKSLLKEMDLSMHIMIKDVCEYLDG